MVVLVLDHAAQECLELHPQQKVGQRSSRSRIVNS
jgi:hypothetical protein